MMKEIVDGDEFTGLTVNVPYWLQTMAIKHSKNDNF